jgi:DNA-binding NarL/FixJ family response regulator
MIRIFIADDHALVRGGIRQMLATESDLMVVGEAADGQATLDALSSTPCDVLLLDLSLPKLSGSAVLELVRARHPNCKVLIVSMYAEQQFAGRLLKAGASGYLPKDRPAKELLAAIREVAEGRLYHPSGGESSPSVGDAPHETLTAREQQVFTLLYLGKTVSDIAAELNLGGSTVSTHVARIKTKLGAHGIGEIVSYAHRAGLID